MDSPKQEMENSGPERLLVRRLSEGKFYAMVLTGALQAALLIAASRAEWWTILTVVATGALHIFWFRDAMWGNRNMRPRGQITRSLSVSFIVNGSIQASYLVFAPVGGIYVAITAGAGALAFLVHTAIRYMSSKVAADAQ